MKVRFGGPRAPDRKTKHKLQYFHSGPQPRLLFHRTDLECPTHDPLALLVMYLLGGRGEKKGAGNNGLQDTQKTGSNITFELTLVHSHIRVYVQFTLPVHDRTRLRVRVHSLLRSGARFASAIAWTPRVRHHLDAPANASRPPSLRTDQLRLLRLP